MPTRKSTRRSKTYHHGNLEHALVDAVSEMISERGNWDCSMRDIARRVGVSHNAAYSHFPDKTALLAAVAERAFEALRSATAEAAAAYPDDPEEQFLAIGMAYVKFGCDRPAHFRLMFGPLFADGDWASMKAAGQAAFDELRTVLKRCAAAGLLPESRIEELAISAWAFVHGLTTLAVDGRAEPFVRDAKTIMQAVRIGSYSMLGGFNDPRVSAPRTKFSVGQAVEHER